jgi:hypothetical protein
MDCLGSNHVGIPTDTHATIEELCFLCVVRAERPCICCIYIHLITCKVYILTTDLLVLTVTLANDRPILSSERAPHINKPATV